MGSFDQRFAGLDCEARENLLAMLSRFDDLPGNLLNEASDALQRAGITDEQPARYPYGHPRDGQAADPRHAEHAGRHHARIGPAVRTHGAAPAGGWPIVVWAHGTTTPGQKTCAPSLSPDLDGGLTRDGFVSYYAYQIAELVNAGYAVVAPDFEGLVPVATVPHPYFSEASLAWSLISGVLAAREADPALSRRTRPRLPH